MLLHSLKTLTLTLKKRSPLSKTLAAAMAINLHSHAFAGNPLRSKPLPSFLETLKSLQSSGAQDGLSSNFKVLPFKNGRPLARSSDSSPPTWHLGWISPADLSEFPTDSFVYLGSEPEEEGGDVYWAVDSSDAGRVEWGGDGFCFADLRTLMVATDWADARAMRDLAIAGHVV